MFQTFATRSDPGQGARRVSALRAAMTAAGLDGFLVPRADAWQGEVVAPCDERLAWLTGFTGSAGLCIVLKDKAALLVDGRYTLAAASEVDTGTFEIVPSLEVRAAGWLATALPQGGVIGFDPWLHGREEIEALEKAKGLTLRPGPNLIDQLWTDRPAPPQGRVSVQDIALSGEDHASKRTRLAEGLRKSGAQAAVLTDPASLAWLLNIRGSDIPREPVPHGFAILQDDARVSLFIDPAKLDAPLRHHLGNQVALAPQPAFAAGLAALQGPVALDKASCPVWVAQRLEAAGIAIVWDDDPCLLPRARKNAAEIAGARAAHLRDAVAMAQVLCWLEAEAPKGQLDEIAVVTQLERLRAASGQLRDLSFDTICGSGPNGAIIHYHVSAKTNRRITPGDVLLVDSGAQYPDGTTDITRTVATGPVPDQVARAFTLVLKGMIAVSTARWPTGLGGRDLDPLARIALWQAGLDYDHGTGHGVGSYLQVHEGPQGISRRTKAPLEAGMIVSNEPGYYRPGAFGIRIENLLVVTPAEIPPGGDRAMHGFETLTLAPIDRRLIRPALLTDAERSWLNTYHARVLAEAGPLCDSATNAWLKQACAPV